MTSTSSAPKVRPAPAPGITAPAARPLLFADAALTAVNGLAYVAIPGVLGEWFGMSSGLLVALGVVLLVVAADVGFIATRRPIPRGGVRGLAILNFAWVLASVVYVIVADLTTTGVIWGLVQAAVVAVAAEIQLTLTRRA